MGLDQLVSKKKKEKPKVNKIELAVANVLTRMDVLFTRQAVIDKYTVDFLVNEHYIIECYGDFWHCNPQKYMENYYNRGKKQTALEIWKHDSDRKNRLESLGYKFLCLWESDINAGHNVIYSKIKKFLK